MNKLGKTIKDNNAKVRERRELGIEWQEQEIARLERKIRRIRAVFWPIWGALVLAAVVNGAWRFM